MAGTSFVDQLFATQVYVLDTNGNPLNIGYYTDNNNPCSGNIFVYADFAEEFNRGFYPPSTWLKKNWLGIVDPASSITQYCVSKGLKPSWTTTTGSYSAADSPTGPITVVPQVQPGEAITFPNVVSNVEAVASGAANAVGSLVSGAVGGAAGIGSTVLLLGAGVIGLSLVLGGRRR